jgi:opacity protein-like surface antigen
MKKILSVLFLCSVIAVPAFAQNSSLRDKNMFMTLGLGGRYLGETFIGGGMSFGYSPVPSNLFTVEFNAGYYDAGKIGSFYYGPYSRPHWYEGDIKYNYVALEFLFSWNYVIKASDAVDFRFGPTMGVLAVTGSESFDPTTHDGYDIEGIPDSHSETKSSFTAGISAGVTWNILKDWFIDFGYRYLANSGISFDERTLRILGENVSVPKQEFDKSSHQFNITAGWRF